MGCQEVRTLNDVILADKETFIRFVDDQRNDTRAIILNPDGSEEYYWNIIGKLCDVECWKDCKPCNATWLWHERSEFNINNKNAQTRILFNFTIIIKFLIQAFS